MYSQNPTGQFFKSEKIFRSALNEGARVRSPPTGGAGVGVGRAWCVARSQPLLWSFEGWPLPSLGRGRVRLPVIFRLFCVTNCGINHRHRPIRDLLLQPGSAFRQLLARHLMKRLFAYLLRLWRFRSDIASPI